MVYLPPFKINKMCHEGGFRHARKTTGYLRAGDGGQAPASGSG